jgi:hypothetical protein
MLLPPFLGHYLTPLFTEVSKASLFLRGVQKRPAAYLTIIAIDL